MPLRLAALGLTLLLLFAACSASEPAAPPPAAPDDRPNLLVILTDDQGYGDLSAYGAQDLETPAMDRLVDAGMRFDAFYANCPVCSPTRAALLSGRYPEFVGVPGVIRTRPADSWGFLDPDAPLLSERLRAAGYHTALIGKWHLGLEAPNRPNDRGFAFFHGWLGDMMDDYWTHRRHDINYMRRDTSVIDPEGHATDLFTDWAIDYLQARADAPEPFFLFLAYNAPHFPVQPPDDWLARVKAREPHLSEKRARLVAFIEHLDAGIGRVLDTLDETGLAERTLVVFTSDNGGLLSDEANNGPLRDGKQSVYEGGLRVPAAVAWPGRIAPGGRTAYRALTMDLYPTLLDAARVPYDPAAIEGVSFLPTLLGDPQDDSERPLFFSRREGGWRYGGLTIQAVRLGDWKLLQNSPFAPRELYHLAADPLERHDLVDAEPDIARRLDQLLRAHLQRAGAVPWQNPGE